MPENRPFIIPIFIPHAGCPHRCIFCNQTAITGTHREILSPDQVRYEIDRYLQFPSAKSSLKQIAFYGGNFLGLPDHVIALLLSAADGYIRTGQIGGIRFSTRPDTVSSETLNILTPFPVRTIELGVQSMDDDVLMQSERGHAASDTVAAVGLLRQRGYEIGVQLMTGLPGDNEERAMMTTEYIVSLRPHFVRIYPAVVLKNSRLASEYLKGKYEPPDLDSAVTLVKKMYRRFRKHNIPVIRMGLQASEDLNSGQILAGPYHPSFGHLVHSEIFLDLARKKITETGASEMSGRKSIYLYVNPRKISVMRGIGNRNIDILTSEFGLDSVYVRPDPDIDSDDILLSAEKSDLQIACAAESRIFRK